MGGVIGRGVGGVRGAQEEAHGGAHPRPNAATRDLNIGHRRKRGAGRGRPAARATRPIRAARRILVSLPQRC